MLQTQVINQVALIVEKACYRDTNPFGTSIWQNHILEVVKYSDALAIAHQADREICILAALLHDYAGIVDEKYYHQHHLYGMKAAEKLLNTLGFDPQRTEQVKEAIKTHRGSLSLPPQSVEAMCVANADAMAHITQYSSLVTYAHDIRALNWSQSREFVMNKINRSWNKMSAGVKTLFESQYQLIINQLKTAA
ncbi:MULTISPECIES: HD domain-containing protein [unclassified Fusibacter]|uniref:HD domain-containing protein n=1 Tax=unclassified Fusibacter TaxID=2624464 RepID=UPI00101135DA|nr:MULTISPECIES: HD domain-containing protein [unclassified Fusibacter]MCK8058839.1 HD domain-containing protein [Fusibacter sp. A2]NPE21913.1 HD domain-containing protein [Fusibacter sp. A1]RXV61483.1 HD domain-containing protein [Fusibacter sp. A1]